MLVLLVGSKHNGSSYSDKIKIRSYHIIRIYRKDEKMKRKIIHLTIDGIDRLDTVDLQGVT